MTRTIRNTACVLTSIAGPRFLSRPRLGRIPILPPSREGIPASVGAREDSRTSRPLHFKMEALKDDLGCSKHDITRVSNGICVVCSRLSCAC